MEFADFLKYKAKRIFRLSTIINFEMGYLLCLAISIIGAYYSVMLVTLFGIALMCFLMLYKEYKSGHWKGEKRKEYIGIEYERRIKQLEEENKKLRDELYGKQQ